LSGRLRSIVTVGVIAGVTLLGYSLRLGPPPPLTPDETAVAREAQSIASTGRDTAGRRLPLFFHMAGEKWLQPIAVYSTAGTLRVTSTGEWGARFSTVRVVAICAALMYLASRRLFGRETIAMAAAALFLSMPVLFAYGRTATDAAYPLPFVLVWLYCLAAFLDRPRPWLLAIAGLALGIGVYAQPGAPITMGCLAVLTGAVVWKAGHTTRNAVAAGAAGFVLPLLIMVAWFASHPDTYGDTMGRWAILQAHIRFPLDGVRAFVNWTTLGMRASFYWGFFDPSWLFFSAVDRAGALKGYAPFLMPVAVLVPLGISQVWTKTPPLAVLLIGGLLISPIAASTLGEPRNIAQAMPIVPFAVLLASLGVESLLDKGGFRRIAGFVLLAAIPIQFAIFHTRYMAI
jgi:4-amino-4-deoxy-L-arabinose transferase-like glycosyltransferase